MSALAEDTTIPVLEGWITTSEAAKIIGITRQHANRLVRDKVFPSVRKVGTPPLYLIQREEVEAYTTRPTTEEVPA